MQESNVYLSILEKIKKPKSMSETRFTEYMEIILAQIQNLIQDGWDDAAISTYLSSLNILTEHPIENLCCFHELIYFVGSDIYTKMLETSSLSDQQKVSLVIQHLGGYQDKNGDLQISGTASYHFFPDMPPGASFLDIYAKMVQRAYPEGLTITKKDKQLSKTAIKKKYPMEAKVHQFRNQLDRHTIHYVERYRKKHDLKTDEQAIKAILSGNWFYADPQYHNRAQLGRDFLENDIRRESRTLKNVGLLKKIRKRGFYRKILSGDYHSEFIIDEQGQLLSQWKEEAQKMDYRKMAIANGETFNYGRRPRDDFARTHDKLDGIPPRYFDTKERNEIKRDWLSPNDNWLYQLIRRMSEKGMKFKKSPVTQKLSKNKQS
ncbi:DUF3114 domain-containing protein [Candidatus Enterococcus mansonii]|uniref:DUF3114 domain-containing protein n=1 Tax=Candidatus Enterococcus mansonii TaxID=1834181 RepID=A0A242CJ02_9ENTE|nr:DUF3114 domain-containing protein [Enterococcus sp. 4G2_DIV0659]OTO09762.1 hypothetical protein A5880_000443 [Enterococcus sp. 4G2_DIV0659]